MWHKYKLPVLFISAFLIRLIHLNQSLWLDEATTAITIKTHSLTSIITQFSPTDFHPPLYYLMMDIWTNIFGYSEVALRMPSVLFSLGAGWMVYRISKSWWAAAFFLFNPLIIYYSQEARMYSMVTFFVAASFYFLIKFLTPNVKRLTTNFWLMNIFLILSFFTFYASIFYIVTVFLYLLFKKKYKIVFLSFGIWTLAFFAIVPLLMQQYAGSREALVSVTNWSLVLGKVTLKNMLLIPIKFTSGRISFYPKSLYYVLAGGWMMMIASSVILNWFQDRDSRLRGNDKGKMGMMLFFLITPIIFGTLFSFNSPLLQYFRFQYLIIFMSIGLGLTVCHSDPEHSGEESRKNMDPSHPFRMTENKFGMTILIGFISWSFLYLLFPQFHREDWKSLATQLKKDTSEVYMISSSADPVRYYAPNIEVRDIQILDSEIPAFLPAGRHGTGMTKGSAGMTSKDQSVLVLPYTTDIHGVDYRASLTQSGYMLQDTKPFRELTYERWEVSDTP